MNELRNIWYAQDLKTLKAEFEKLSNDFTISYPRASRVDIINHYVDYYDALVKSIESSENRNRQYIDKGHTLVKNASDKRLLEEFENEQNKIHDKLLNETFEYNRMIKWLRSGSKTEATNSKSLKSLFNKPEKYYDVISALLQNDIISKTESSYIVIIPEKYRKKGKDAFVCSIGYNLNRFNFLKFGYEKHIFESLNNLFENSNLSKQNYSSFFKSPRINDYTQYTIFLKDL